MHEASRRAQRLLRLASVAVVVGTIAWLTIRHLTESPAARSHAAHPGGTSGAEASAVAPIRTRTRPARRPSRQLLHEPRGPDDTSGATLVWAWDWGWRTDATLEEIRDSWDAGPRAGLASVGARLAQPLDPAERLRLLELETVLRSYEGDARGAYRTLEEARAIAESDPRLEAARLFTIIYHQGVVALRCAEDDNCVPCDARTACSCILPITAAAFHARPEGARLAIVHFTEYLGRFPDDLEVRWLLNLAHMTLGEHPDGVDRRLLLSLDPYVNAEPGMRRFRETGHEAGVDRLNHSGGAVLEDFDGDGHLDLATTSIDPGEAMAVYRNRGDGTFEDRSVAAGVARQWGGLNCVQTDYDDDGRMDLYVCRGAWLTSPIRPSLLRNVGGGVFEDVTEAAGLLDPVNSNAAQWADYDNDGHLDLFVCCERQPHRLWHNRGDGTFEEVAERAGVSERGGQPKGCAWIDYDNDRFPDLLVSDLHGPARLYHNRRDGTFADVSEAMHVGGAEDCFSCWAWDYDDDGWLDLFVSCYAHTLADVVRGLRGEPASGTLSSRLFHNEGGAGFTDVTRRAGLDGVYAAMGSNFADFDGDGLLDLYLATGAPSLAMLVPNRLFRNVDGARFVDVTAASGTGHLQKGHGVACGDVDRDGDVDLFVQTGGATHGDRARNLLFENPGHGNHWITVKVAGTRSNRAGIGARIRIVTAEAKPRVIHRMVGSGSSFGGNPLEQTIGLGRADRLALLEVYWPTTDTRQTFHDVPVDQAIRITEGATDYGPFPVKVHPRGD